MCDIVFEKAKKGCGSLVNRTNCVEAAVQVFSKKGVMRNFAEVTRKNRCHNPFLGVFL